MGGGSGKALMPQPTGASHSTGTKDCGKVVLKPVTPGASTNDVRSSNTDQIRRSGMVRGERVGGEVSTRRRSFSGCCSPCWFLCNTAYLGRVEAVEL